MRAVPTEIPLTEGRIVFCAGSGRKVLTPTGKARKAGCPICLKMCSVRGDGCLSRHRVRTVDWPRDDGLGT